MKKLLQHNTPEATPCGKPAALIGRTEDIQKIVMGLYFRTRELEKGEVELARDVQQETDEGRRAPMRDNLEKVRAELKTVRETMNEWGAKQAPSDYKSAAVKGSTIGFVTAGASLLIEGAVISVLEGVQQLQFLAHGLYEWAFLGLMGLGLAVSVGATMDGVYSVRSGVDHCERMVDQAVGEILKAQGMGCGYWARRKARWMFMNNIRITPSSVLLPKSELLDSANEALKADEPRDYSRGDIYVKVNPDATAIYKKNGRPIVVKCAEGFGVCGEDGEFTGFANYSSNNMNLTSLQRRLEHIKHYLMKEPQLSQQPQAVVRGF